MNELIINVHITSMLDAYNLLIPFPIFILYFLIYSAISPQIPRSWI